MALVPAGERTGDTALVWVEERAVCGAMRLMALLLLRPIAAGRRRGKPFTADDGLPYRNPQLSSPVPLHPSPGAGTTPCCSR